jgi:hypothetical protein
MDLLLKANGRKLLPHKIKILHTIIQQYAGIGNLKRQANLVASQLKCTFYIKTWDIEQIMMEATTPHHCPRLAICMKAVIVCYSYNMMSE